MPVSQVDKALNLCTRLMAAAGALMDAVEELQNLKDEKESSGVDFTAAAVETALGTSVLKHANGTDFNNVLSSGAAAKTWLETNFHDDIFDKVRP
jgi:Tfp pilus assembly protein PilX